MKIAPANQPNTMSPHAHAPINAGCIRASCNRGGVAKVRIRIGDFEVTLSRGEVMRLSDSVENAQSAWDAKHTPA